MSRLSQSLSLSSLVRHNLTDVNNVATYQRRRPKFTQKENFLFSSIVNGLDQGGKGRGGDQNSHTKKVLLNYKWPGSGRKGCSTHVDVGLIFVWKQAGTPRAKVNLVNV